MSAAWRVLGIESIPKSWYRPGTSVNMYPNKIFCLCVAVSFTMVRKCSVYGCKTNYVSKQGGESSKPTTIYGFPTNPEQRAQWVASLPNQMAVADVTKNMGVCAKHFPADVPLTLRGRHMVPASPPSIFFNVPSSCIPTQHPQPRSTVKSSSASRARDVDEMSVFREMDAFCSVEDFPDAFASKHPSMALPHSYIVRRSDL